MKFIKICKQIFRRKILAISLLIPFVIVGVGSELLNTPESLSATETQIESTRRYRALKTRGRIFKKTTTFNNVLTEIRALAQARQPAGTAIKYNATINAKGLVAIDNRIDGWMSNKDLLWLFNTAREMNQIVEIGSWKGRSTHALLSGGNGTVNAVDHFLGSIDELEDNQYKIQVKSIYKDFMQNVGGFKNLQVLKMDNARAVKQFKDKSVDMVFIDGCHIYEEVLGDIQRWLPKTRKIICGHDISDERVKKAVKEMFGNNFEKSKDDIWIKRITTA